MKRRSFFRTLATLAGAASLSPNIFVPKFEPVKWKVRKAWRIVPKEEFERIAIRHPEYDEAWDMTLPGIYNQYVGVPYRNFYGTWKFTIGTQSSLLIPDPVPNYVT